MANSFQALKPLCSWTTASADHVDIEGLNLALVTLNMMYAELSCSKMAYAEDDVDRFPWHLAWSSPTLLIFTENSTKN